MVITMTGNRQQVQHDNMQISILEVFALLYQLKIKFTEGSIHDLKSMKPQTKTKTTGAMM